MREQYNYFDEMREIRKAHAEKRRELEAQKTEEEKQKDIALGRLRIQMEQLGDKMEFERCVFFTQRYLTFQKMAETARVLGERNSLNVEIAYLEENIFGGTINLIGEHLGVTAWGETERNDFLWLVKTAEECYISIMEGLLDILLIYNVYQRPQKTPEA